MKPCIYCKKPMGLEVWLAATREMHQQEHTKIRRQREANRAMTEQIKELRSMNYILRKSLARERPWLVKWLRTRADDITDAYGPDSGSEPWVKAEALTEAADEIEQGNHRQVP